MPIQTEQAGDSISEQVNTIVQQVFANPIEQIATESLGDKVNYVIQASNYILNQSIESFNELIKTYISDIQEQAYEMSNTEMEQWSRDKENYSNQLSEKWDDFLSLDTEISKLNDQIQSENSYLEYIAREYKSSVENSNAREVEIWSSCQVLESRSERYNDRYKRWTETMERIKDRVQYSSVRPTDETMRSLEQEASYLEREWSSMKQNALVICKLDWRIKLEKMKERGRKVLRKWRKEIYSCFN